MHILIPGFPNKFNPGEAAEAAAWPSLISVDPLGGAGRVALQLWDAEGAYKEGAEPFPGTQEFGPGNGLPTYAEMEADPACQVPMLMFSHYLLSKAAERWPGATVELNEQEAAVVGAFAQFMEKLS